MAPGSECEADRREPTTTGTYKMASRQWIIGLTLLACGRRHPQKKASRPMSTIKIERLGDASPSPKKGGWRKSEAGRNPPPIVLWRGQTWQLLLLPVELESVLGRYQQKSHPSTPAPRPGSRLWGSDFPIKLSEHLLVNRRRNRAASLMSNERSGGISSTVDEQVFGEA